MAGSLAGRGRTPTDLALATLPAVLVAAGLVAVAVTLVSGDTSQIGRLELLAALALVGSLMIGRLAHRAPRDLVVVSVVLVGAFAGSVLLGGLLGAPLEAGLRAGVGEALRLGTVLATCTSLVLLIRHRRGSGMRSIVVDTLIVSLGSWMLTWVLIVEPTLAGRDGPEAMIVIRGVTHSLAVTVAFLVVLLVSSGARRALAVWLVAGSALVGIGADFTAGLMEAGRLSGDPVLVESLFILAMCLGAAGFAHRSIGRLDEFIPRHRSHSQGTRILLTIACLPAPALLLTLTDPSGPDDRIVRTASLVVLTLAITLRVADAIHTNNVAHLQLLRHAQQDPLTGLPNRTLLGGRIAEALDAAVITNTRPTLLFIGLDRFKNVNDSLGHDVGDEVLRLVARRLLTAMPNHAHVGRIAGDEFVVLDPTVRSVAEGASLAERALSLFREPLHVGAGDMYVMASIGVAVGSPTSTTAQELQRNADTAMVRAKESGGNCVQVFDDAMYQRVFRRLEIESGLHRALERRELHLYYQPIVDLISGEVTGFEALMRWQMADGRIVSPAEFIPVAEDTGLIVSIGNWALLEALTQLRTWIDEGVCSRHATMSVNVSPRQLRDPSLISAVGEALRRSGVAPRSVWLEVTESVMISEPDQALAALRRLQQLNVRVAIDDFGTGYSSLSLLRKFPLQRIKIDRTFISGMTDDESAHSLVRTIVAMAGSLNLDLVAEGLESRDQLRALTALGCRKAQGFLISSPVTASAMRSTVLGLESAGLWTGGLQLSWPDD